MKNLLNKCNWPKLSKKYDIALRDAVEFILERYSVSGIIASGTIIRGNPDPASDLDIYVIHQKSFRQRIQRFFNNIPAEIFVNPPQAIEMYFEEEQASRTPLTAHMFATGFVILDLDPIVGKLQNKAKRLLSKPPGAPVDLTYKRYLAALLYEDAVDIVDRDQECAEMIVYKAVGEMLNFCFLQAGCFIPRPKSLLIELAKSDPGIADLARSFYQESSFAKKMELAAKIADQIIGECGFFEWESTPESVTN